MTATTRPRIVFAGTPAFAVASLEALLSANVEIVGVFTQPDRKAGRGKELKTSPVKLKALDHYIPLFQPESFKSRASRDLIDNLKADLMVVTAYGLILPSKVLVMPRLGCINIHASLLPRWRGAAPIQRTIEAGDTTTGICIIQMEKGLDTGPVLAKACLNIGADETGGQLHDRLLQLSKQCLTQHLPAIIQHTLKVRPQEDVGITYARKLEKLESRLDWTHTATNLFNKVRAFNPWPVAISRCCETELRILTTTATEQQTNHATGTVVAIDQTGIHIQTGEGCLVLQTLQRPGKKPMGAKILLNGFKLSVGDRFE